MFTLSDARRRAETVGRSAAGEIAKPLYAGVGLGELAARQLSELPAQARTRARDLQERAGILLSPAALRRTAAVYGDQAGHAYGHFASRGEQVVLRARRRPGVRQAEATLEAGLDRLDEQTERAAEAASGAAEAAVRTERKATRSGRSAARAATARKSAPRRKQD